MEYLRKIWSGSKVYRVVLIAAIIYAVLRLAVQGVLLAGMLLPGPEGEGELVPIDLQLYLDAAESLHLQEERPLQSALLLWNWEQGYTTEKEHS